MSADDKKEQEPQEPKEKSHKVAIRVAVDGWVIGNESHTFGNKETADAFAGLFLGVVQAVSALAGRMAGATLKRSVAPSEKVE